MHQEVDKVNESTFIKILDYFQLRPIKKSKCS